MAGAHVRPLTRAGRGAGRRVERVGLALCDHRTGREPHQRMSTRTGLPARAFTGALAHTSAVERHARANGLVARLAGAGGSIGSARARARAADARARLRGAEGASGAGCTQCESIQVKRGSFSLTPRINARRGVSVARMSKPRTCASDARGAARSSGASCPAANGAPPLIVRTAAAPQPRKRAPAVPVQTSEEPTPAVENPAEQAHVVALVPLVLPVGQAVHADELADAAYVLAVHAAIFFCGDM